MSDNVQIRYSSSEDDLDDDLKTSDVRFPSSGGMTCPVTGCPSNTNFASYGGLRTHWRKVHEEKVKMFECHLCGKQNYKRCEITKHLQQKHKVMMTKLRESISQIRKISKTNNRYVNPGTVRMPKPVSVIHYAVDAPSAPSAVPDFYELLHDYDISDPSFKN